MSVEFIGTTFPPSSQWHQHEVDLCSNIVQQVDHAWPNCANLIINTTWFGPQFDNTQYADFLLLVKQKQFDQLFIIAAVDPVCLTTVQLDELASQAGATKTYLLGNFDSEFQFNFISTMMPLYFRQYALDDLKMSRPGHLYINYNRKPRAHRIDLVEKLKHHNLLSLGVVSLGRNDPLYSHRDQSDYRLLGERPDDYAGTGNWGMSMEFGIPHDIHSLGNMQTWQTHFLTLVSETEFLPWDPLFVTEKTWKPILGLRPFIINGQPKIYAWLRDQGFHTFNHYWDHVDLENANELEVHDRIVQVLEYLSTMSAQELTAMYDSMLPSLRHNQAHFAEFVKTQIHKINHLFDHVGNT